MKIKVLVCCAFLVLGSCSFFFWHKTHAIVIFSEPIVSGQHITCLGAHSCFPNDAEEWAWFFKEWVRLHPEFTLVHPVTTETMQQALDNYKNVEGIDVKWPLQIYYMSLTAYHKGATGGHSVAVGINSNANGSYCLSIGNGSGLAMSRRDYVIDIKP